MPNIIQIEELVYGRLPQVSKADWVAMLTEHGAHADYTTFKNDYLLLEQSDYRFADGKMISSERIVYNIDYLTYDTERNAPDPDNTTEKVTTRYEASTDRYFVYYTHYPSSENDIPLADIPLADIPLADILSEADMPITGTFHQAPQEKQLVSFSAPKSPTADSKKIQPSSTPTTEYHKPWRQKRLAQLMIYYKQGYTAKEIADEMECLESSVYYQLEHYLNVSNPFAGGWISRHDQKPIVPKHTEITSPKPNPRNREGFYRPGAHIHHYLWGDATVLKDNEDVLKLLLPDGTKRTIRK